MGARPEWLVPLVTTHARRVVSYRAGKEQNDEKQAIRGQILLAGNHHFRHNNGEKAEAAWGL